MNAPAISYGEANFDRIEACICFPNLPQRNKFRLNVNKLAKERCHLIYSDMPAAQERMVATAMEFIYFHPNTPRNDDFHLSYERCGEVLMGEVSFPIKHLADCQRIAKCFEGTVVNLSRHMSFSNTHIHIPPAPNVVIYQPGKQGWGSQQIERDCNHIIAIANHPMTVD